MGKAFWIGLIGGFLGFVGGIIAVLVGSISATYSTSSQSTTLYGLGLAAFIFSIVGVTGGVFERRRLIGGTLMLIAAVGVLVSISLFGLLPFLFFLVGAIVIFARKTEHEVVSHQPSVAHSESFAAAQETSSYTSASSTLNGTALSSTHSYTVCGRCGKKLTPKAIFCSGCGMSII
ncbi:MAG: zinc ribbon domain-containing protein [Halobacteriota archaeon]